jgi:hypothetical protein
LNFLHASIFPSLALVLVLLMVAAAACRTSEQQQPSKEPLSQTQAVPPPVSCEQRLAGMDFSVDDVYTGPIAAPRLDRNATPEAWRLRTMIRQGARNGPNFAGHYTVASWGCGTECQMHAVLDARTGKVVTFGVLSSFGLGYTVRSALLVVNPIQNAPEPSVPGMVKHISLFERTHLQMRDGTLNELCRENAAVGIRAVQ